MSKRVCMLMVSIILAGCNGTNSQGSGDVALTPSPQAGDIDLKVVVNAGGHTSTEMTSLIQDGIHRSRVSCIDLANQSGSSYCRLVWTINRSASTRPIISVIASLYVNGNLSQTLITHMPSLGVHSRLAFVREVSDMMETLQARTRRQRLG